MSSGPIEKVAEDLVMKGLRRCRFRYDDEERGRAGLETVGAVEDFSGCCLADELPPGVVGSEVAGDRWDGGV